MSANAQTNRANAQHSTGPKTPEGKQRSSLNALRHGLTAVPSEDLAAYQAHLQSFIDQYDPQDPTESHLLQTLADIAWRNQRVAIMEANLLAAAPNPSGDAMSIVVFLEKQTRALSSLSLHGQRLSRQFEKTLAQLRQLQSNRKAKEEYDMELLLEIMEIHEKKGEPYGPSEDGFVFTPERIDQAILVRNREILALKSATTTTRTKAYRRHGTAMRKHADDIRK